MPITDYEDVLLAAEEAKQRAKALRQQTASPQGQMAGGFMVAPHWSQQLAPVVNSVLASGNEHKARRLGTEANQAMQTDATNWMNQRPQPTMAPTGPELPGPVEEGAPPLQGLESTPPTQQQNLAWAQQGMRNPLTKALASKYGEDVLIKEPERVEAREARKEEKAADREARLEQVKLTLEQREIDARRRSEDVRYAADARAEAAKEALLLRQQIAANNQELARARIDAANDRDRLNREERARQFDTRLETNKKKMGAKAAKELEDVAELETGLDLAIEKITPIKENPVAAWGRGVITEKAPGGDRIAAGMRSDENNRARAMAANVSGEIQHGRYGTALSKTEASQARAYIPGPHDDAQVIKWKLEGLRELIQVNKRRQQLMLESGLSLEEAQRAIRLPPKGAAAVPGAPGAAPGGLPPGVTVEKVSP